MSPGLNAQRLSLVRAALTYFALMAAHATASAAELLPLSQQDVEMVERLQLSGSIGTALLQLGDLYRDGEITAADGQRALSYYMRMAGSADPSAITAVLPANGFIRENGRAEANGQAAAEIYTEALSVGQADALLRLGDLYSDGDVVPQNLSAAFDYYWQAASSGSDTGKLRIGEMLITGSGAERDVVTGLALVQEVAHAGNPNGLIALGDLLADGRLGATDAAAAIANYEQAGDLGRSDAWVRLADLFRSGNGIAKDPARALGYYRRAMDAGNLAGTLRFGELLIRGEGISADIPRGLQLINAAAQDDNVDAFTLLGDIYSGQAGAALPVDFALAFQHYQRAVDAGSDSAKLRLGEMLARGQGVAQDRARGLHLLGEVAAAGNVRAYLTLADIQLDAAAGPVDVPAAITALKHAGDLGDPVALLRLGDLMSNGQLVAPEPAKALEFYRGAMAAGSQTAQLRVGEMLARGEGVAKDFAGGTALVRQIAMGGNASGYLLLGDLLAGAVEPDGATAVAAYEQAATLGRKDALLRLGDLYRDGKIVARDGQRAVAYYLEAAAAEPTPSLPEAGQ